MDVDAQRHYIRYTPYQPTDKIKRIFILVGRKAKEFSMENNLSKQKKTSEDEGKKAESYSREQLEKEIEKAVSKSKGEWEKGFEERLAAEREEAARLATMSTDERSKLEFDKKQKAFDEERSQYMNERMEFEAAKALSQAELPISFAGILKGQDPKTTAENISVFKEEFLKAVETEVSDRLKGFTPRTGVMPSQSDPFLNGLGR